MKKITLLCFLFIGYINYCYSQDINLNPYSQTLDLYDPITGGTVLGTATNDDSSFNNVPIGFNFVFGGTTYTQVGIQSNGFIALGGTVFSSYTAISDEFGSNNVIAAFNGDLQGNATTGELSYITSGTAPDRVFTVQWKSYRHYAAAGDDYNFQIRLFETSNEINIIYGSMTQNATARTRQVGLRGSSNAVFNSRTTTDDWSATIAATANTASCALTTTIFPASGLTFIWSPPAACTGTPTPGNTIAPQTTACSNVPFTLSLQNLTEGSGVSYQWQTSTDGIAYTNATGASTSSTYVATQSAVTYYRCLVTCTTTSAVGTSTPVMVGVSSALSCYCIPAYTTGKTDGDLISNIVISGTTLSNNTGTDPVNPAYTYFTGQPNYTANLQAGSSYNITVSVGTFGNQNVAVWIDYNDDGFFGTSERVGFTTASITSNGSATFPITLACNPALGTHRMRVRDVYFTSGNTIDPCASYGFGETEDYDVTISAAVACPQPSALTATGITANSATIGWTTGCAELSWNLYVVPAGAPAPTGTPTYVTQVNPFVIGNLTASTTYDIYIAADCTTNGVSLLTGPYTFTTTPNPPVNDECSGAIALTVNTDLACTSQTAGTVNAATPSNVDATSCFGAEDDDVWFSFVATATTHRIQLNGVSNFTDMAHSLWTGNCGTLTLVPNSCSDADTSNPSGLVIGQTYYVRVNSYGTTPTTATFNICVGTPPPPPANDECANASVLTFDDSFCNGTNNNGTNVSATNSGVANPACFNYGQNDVWFSFVVPAGVGTINVSTDFTGGTLVDTEIALYSGTCGSFNLIACDQDGGTTVLSNGSSYNSLITNAAVTAGQTYYVRVSGYSASAVGTFCLRASTNTLATNSFDTNSFSYYPNPVRDVLNLSYIQTISKVQINNLLGQEVLSKVINANESQIDMSSLPKGTYLVNVTAEGLTKTIKVIKE